MLKNGYYYIPSEIAANYTGYLIVAGYEDSSGTIRKTQYLIQDAGFKWRTVSGTLVSPSFGEWRTGVTTSDFAGKTLWSGSANSGNIVNVGGYQMLGMATADANNSSSSRSVIYIPILNNGSPYFVPALFNGSWSRLRISVSSAGMLSIVESDGPYITAIYGYGKK